VDRRAFISTMAGALASPLAAGAQQSGRVARIGLLSLGSAAAGSELFDAFRAGLYDLGHIERQTFVLEYRGADGQPGRLPTLAAELVGLQVDVIFATATPAALAAQQATRTIPIVFATAADPVGAGLVVSLSAPGGNVTGLSLFAPELVAKQVQLLKEALPKASRVAVLANPTNVNTGLMIKATEAAAGSLGIRVQVLEVRSPDELERGFSALTKGRASALLILFDPFLFAERTRVVAFANDNRLPAMYPHREYAEAGGLMAYGADVRDNFRRAAAYVQKILTGAKPADIPVEQPSKFELVMNLKTANALGLTIPPSLLLRADQVIE